MQEIKPRQLGQMHRDYHGNVASLANLPGKFALRCAPGVHHLTRKEQITKNCVCVCALGAHSVRACMPVQSMYSRCRRYISSHRNAPKSLINHASESCHDCAGTDDKHTTCNPSSNSHPLRNGAISYNHHICCQVWCALCTCCSCTCILPDTKRQTRRWWSTRAGENMSSTPGFDKGPQADW